MPTAQDPIQQRRDYVAAFNTVMVQIWKERVAYYNAIRPGSGVLYRSISLIDSTQDADVITVAARWQFVEYGLYVNRGTGRETHRGNPGDIGRDKKRKAKPWMTPRFWSSYCNIRDFMAKSLGQQFIASMQRILTGAANMTP